MTLSFRLSDEFVAGFADRPVPWGYADAAGNSLGEITFLRTYSRKKPCEHGNVGDECPCPKAKERWHEVCRRVIEGMFTLQKDHARANRLPWSDVKAQRSAEDAYERLFTFKWTPPGRGLWMMGTPLVMEHRNSAALQNCLAGDTTFLTETGVRALADMVGEQVTVLTEEGWATAEVNAFGEQSVQRVVLAPAIPLSRGEGWRAARSNVRRSVTATANHRWKLVDGTITEALKVGDAVPAVAAAVDDTSVEYTRGRAHGIVFADGAHQYTYVDGTRRYELRLCGAKAALLEAINPDHTYAAPSHGGDPTAVFTNVREDWKALPLGKGPDYIAGFIQGWIDGDASSTANGTVVLSSTDPAAGAWLDEHAALGGYLRVGYSADNRDTNYGKRTRPLVKHVLAPAAGRAWKVVEIEPLPEPELVYCATVPSTSTFTLAAGILTGNCAFVSTDDMTKTDPSAPFAFLMEASMLGIGVGFDTKGGEKGFRIHAPKAVPPAQFELDETGRALPPKILDGGRLVDPADLGAEVFVVTDDREGWVASVTRLLDAYLKPGQTLPVWDYSQVRPAGEPIRTFGGTAAGPGPLRKLHEALRGIFTVRLMMAPDGELPTLSTTDVLDIGNLIGVCVVSGNVRRSAELAIGRLDDQDFLDAKDFSRYAKNEETGEWETTYEGSRQYRAEYGWMSNNSVAVNVGDDLSGIVEGIKRNGEPGVLWMDTSRAFGRLIDPANNKDHRAAGYNPCVTDDTWVMTTEGPRQVRDLIGRSFTALVNGKPFQTLSKGFWLTGTDREVFDLTTEQGYTVRLTDNHQVLTAERGWVPAGELLPGEKVNLHVHEGASWDGRGSEAEGYLLGHLWGDGTLVGNRAVLSLWGDQPELRDHIERLAASLPHRSDWKGFMPVPDRDEWRLNSTALAGLAGTYGIVRGNKRITDEVEQASSAFYAGFLRAAFDTDGGVEGSLAKGVSIRLHQSDRDQLERAQRMLSRLGILSTIYSTRGERTEPMPDGHGGMADYTSKASWRLVITGEDAFEFMARVGFADQAKAAKWEAINADRKRAVNGRRPYATFIELVPAGRANVYDVTVEDVHAFDANGLYVHNCAEQTLESYECCTLVETFLGRHEDLEDYKRTLKVAYLYAKTVTLIPTHWQRTNAIMQRNRRIGTSMSGVANFADNRGINVLRAWMDAGYETVAYYDRVYSEWLCVRESIKTTTVKPSGTVSILAGESPGVHWAPGGEFFERRIRFSNADPMVTLFRQAGYSVEPDAGNPDTTVVVAFPIHSSAKRSEKQVTLFEKAHLAAMAQRHWSDNSVSVTLSFDQEREAEHIGTVLAMYEGQFKTVSFLPQGNDVYQQMPYTEITQDVYDEGRMTLFPVDLAPIYDGLGVEALGEAYCSTDSCEVKSITNTAEAAVAAETARIAA